MVPYRHRTEPYYNVVTAGLAKQNDPRQKDITVPVIQGAMCNVDCCRLSRIKKAFEGWQMACLQSSHPSSWIMGFMVCMVIHHILFIGAMT
jgi:hypothetical protein